MADAPATKKDLDALQKTLQKQIDDLKNWAKGQEAGRTKDLIAVTQDIKALKDKTWQDREDLAKAINELGAWARQEIVKLKHDGSQ